MSGFVIVAPEGFAAASKLKKWVRRGMSAGSSIFMTKQNVYGLAIDGSNLRGPRGRLLSSQAAGKEE